MGYEKTGRKGRNLEGKDAVERWRSKDMAKGPKCRSPKKHLTQDSTATRGSELATLAENPRSGISGPAQSGVKITT